MKTHKDSMLHELGKAAERLLKLNNKKMSVYSYGEYTFYTDKRCMIIRVPKIDGITGMTQDLTTKQAETLSQFNYVPHHDGKWFDLKDIYVKPKVLVCDICRGTGRLSVTKCPECDGHGDVDIENDYNKYNVTCQTCDGKGVIGKPENPASFPCLECDGTGNCGYENYGRVYLHKDYDEALYADYLEVLITLPVIQIFMPRCKEDYSIFRFDGGEAILMGMLN